MAVAMKNVIINSKTLFSGSASPFSPSSLSPILWLDAQTPGTLTISDTDKVDEWASRAAGGSATGTGGSRPTLSATAFGAGKPGVVFTTAANTQLLLSSFTTLGNASAFTIAMAMKSPSIQGNNAVFGPSTGYAGGVELVETSNQFLRINGANLNVSSEPAIVTASPATTLWSSDNATSVTVMSFSASSNLITADGSIAAWRDGALIQDRNVVSDNVGTTGTGWANGVYSIGNYASGYGNFSKDMTMGEFIIVGRLLTTNERQSLESYLSTRWA